MEGRKILYEKFAYIALSKFIIINSIHKKMGFFPY